MFIGVTRDSATKKMRGKKKIMMKALVPHTVSLGKGQSSHHRQQPEHKTYI